MRKLQNRREFGGLMAAGIVGVVGSGLLKTVFAEGLDPDLVVFNAKIYTMDSSVPRAAAFAVKGGRFAVVGSTDEVKTLAGKSTQMFDAKQMTIVPGFTDCHNHAPGTTLLYDVLVGNPYEVEFVTISSIVEKLRERAKE